jgi:hypothetical protein
MKIRPLCQSCFKNPAAVNYIKGDEYHFRTRCDSCIRKNKKLKPRQSEWALSGYKKKPHCEKCGFRADYTEQLSVYHIDGNLKNTNILNLKTVCNNCQIAISKQKLGWKQGDLIPDF